MYRHTKFDFHATNTNPTTPASLHDAANLDIREENDGRDTAEQVPSNHQGPTCDANRRARKEAIAFTLELGLALHRYGVPADRIEASLARVSERFGLLGMFSSTPTALFASFRTSDFPSERPPTELDPSDRQTFMIRADPGETNLSKMADVDRLVAHVVQGQLQPAEGRRELAAIEQRPNIYGPTLMVLAHALASSMAAVLLGGGGTDMAVAAVSGLLAGLLNRLNDKGPRFSRLVAPLTAFVSALLPNVARAIGLGVSEQVCIISGLIVLVPGLTLTAALRELAAGHLVSGTARVSSALILFVQMGFGVALGLTAANLLPGATATIEASSLPSWAMWPAVVGMVPAFVVLFRSAPREWVWILLGGLTAVGAARLGAMALGPTLGSFTGALALGLGSHLLANRRDRPAQTTLVPGIMYLVPGSVGLRSLTFLLDQDVVTGIQTAFTMTMVGVSLVAGLVFASALLPARREL